MSHSLAERYSLSIVGRTMDLDVKLELYEVVQDMSLPSEAIPHGAEIDGKPFQWALHPRSNLGSNPASQWKFLTPTGMIYNVDPSPTEDTRVQIKNLRMYALKAPAMQWCLLQFVPNPVGHNYKENFVNDQWISAQSKPISKGIEFSPKPYWNFHFFSKERVPRPEFATYGIFVAYEVRQNGEAKSGLVASASADYWVSAGNTRSRVGVNNQDAAIGRFKLVGRNWRNISMNTILPPIMLQAGVPNPDVAACKAD